MEKYGITSSAQASKPDSLLMPLGIVTVPATKKFVASENFIIDLELASGVKIPFILWPRPRVKIPFIDENFSQWFLNKIEEPKPETTVCFATLVRPSFDEQILAERAKETTLAEIYQLMLNQPNGENGPLLNNGRANVFYVGDALGVLRAVGLIYHKVGWLVNARPVGHPNGSGGDVRIFFRN